MEKPRISRNPIKRAVAKVRQKLERRAKRAAPSGLHCALADRVGFLNPAHWDALTRDGSFFMTRAYRELLELHAPAGMCHRYALVYRGDQPIVALAAQVVEISGNQLANLPDSKLRKKALGQFRARILVCGSLVSSGFHGIAFAKDEDPALLWHAVAEALYRIRRADKLHGDVEYVMVKDLDATQNTHARPLADFSYRPLKTEVEMAMPLRAHWRKFDDYLADLNTSYRGKAKKLVKQVAEAGYRVERDVDAAAHDARLNALYREVESRAATRLSALPPGYFGALAQAAGRERFRCSVIRNDEGIAGFITTIKDGDRALGYYVGLDYAVNAKVPLYLRLLQVLIEDAIDLGCTELSFGRTAMEPKAALGATARESHVWLRHRVPVVNALLRELVVRVEPDAAPQRKPFKESAGDRASA
jgi:hypothetical protein